MLGRLILPYLISFSVFFLTLSPLFISSQTILFHLFINFKSSPFIVFISFHFVLNTSNVSINHNNSTSNSAIVKVVLLVAVVVVNFFKLL